MDILVVLSVMFPLNIFLSAINVVCEIARS